MRPLQVVGPDAATVLVALRGALSGEGAAILPHDAAPDGVPAEVENRVALVAETSGTTATPKRVVLSRDALLASAAASEAALGGPGQWLLALPARYIAGINVLVRSIAAQIDPVILPPEGFAPDRFVDAAARMSEPVRYTSLVPAQLQLLLESDAAVQSLRRFERVLVGGQSSPAGLTARATELGIRITRSYGATETCGGCIYDGGPIGNARVRVESGRIEISGSVLAEGYLADPEGTSEAFFTDEGQRWYRTDDAGVLEGGVLRVTGRVDDVFVSGGLKVSRADVEAAVRALPGLEDAIVVVAPSERWGQVPVVVSAREVPLAEVRAAVAGSLGLAAAPDRMVVMDPLPVLPSGKPDRRMIARLALQ